MSDETARDGGYDDFLDALDAGDGYGLVCANGHGWVPPRRVCPRCGSREFSKTDLPDTGRVIARTTIHVAAPQFGDDTPYVLAIVDLGPLSVTGQIDTDGSADIPRGLEVSPTVMESVTDGGRFLGFEPVETA
jgi:uncharacterized OB-fold protein